jgi:sugar lactone lactonase YvrE
MKTARQANQANLALTVLTLLALIAAAAATSSPARAGTGVGAPSRSTTIVLTQDGSRLLNLNHEADSVSVFEVTSETGDGALRQIAEIAVGNDPSCIAVRPEGDLAFVTNSADGTISVIALTGENANTVTRTMRGGVEPFGCALTPSGKVLYVSELTAGRVRVIDTTELRLIRRLRGFQRPAAIAITNDGDAEDEDETVFVTEFYAELIGGGPGEGFDDGKRGVVHAFSVGGAGAITNIYLSPLANSGFTANRANFCTQLNANAVNDTFCPDTGITDPADPVIAADPQAVFPNQLGSALICGSNLYLPNVGAQPEPPVQFTVNVQGLVYVVDTSTLEELTDRHVNLNAQIRREADPANPTASLDRLFSNDLVAIDATADCSTFLIVSRGGNYVIRAGLVGDVLDIGAPVNPGDPSQVVRYQTGNIPTGVVISPDGARAFVNNEVNLSVSVLDLDNDTVLARDVASSTPPNPGSHDHAVLMGKLVFFTALGVPDNGLVGRPIRGIVPLESRGKQSNNAWSTCASCHPFGLSDGVTWLFGDGPRNTIPLDALYSKINGQHDTRINNWSAARDSVTDFNNNSRGVQGGRGFASDPPFTADVPNPGIFDHGISQGASEALDFETAWAATVRPLNLPRLRDVDAVDAGAAIFETACASCHGGAKWTKSQVLYLNNPALDKAFAAGGTPRDPGLTLTANQAVNYQDAKVDTGILQFLEDVGTFDTENPIEIRGAGAAQGQRSLGVLGFNVPSLLGAHFHAPFFHDGSARSLRQVFNRHGLPEGGTITTGLSSDERSSLLAFLRGLDGRTATFRSDGDVFKHPAENLP